MTARKKTPRKAASSRKNDPLALRPRKEASAARESLVHVYGNRVVCATDTRGHATPGGRSTLEIVVDATDGFIPLWQSDVTLRWRFQPQSVSRFVDPEAAKTALRKLLGKALVEWDTAVPVKFAERRERWDFEIAINAVDDCDDSGCTLAMAFFPDRGRHELLLFPEMFEYSQREQVETLVHELGHVFGLRHFFAKIHEADSPSRVFGKHSSFSIMNYGNKSKLTAADRKDLKTLYERAWDGTLKQINGTKIRLFRPFSATA